MKLISRLAGLGAVPAFCAALTVSFLFATSVSGDTAFLYRDRAFCFDADTGEALLHGLSPFLDDGTQWWHMPAGVTLNALLCNHLPASASIITLMTLTALYPMLVFALGLQLHSPAAGLLAALASTGVLWVLPDETIALQFGLLSTSVAVLAAWRAERPDRRRTVFLAAATGLSLLVRSQLFLFPLILLICESLSLKGERRKESLRMLLACAVILVLFVLPWAVSIRAATGLFNFFEWDWSRPSYTEPPIRRDSFSEAFILGWPGPPPLEAVRSAYVWAASKAITDPWDYGVSILRRCWGVLSMRPFLWMLGALAVWIRFHEKPFRVVGGLALYLLVVENLIQIREIHSVTAWPLLIAVVAAAGLGRLGVPPARHSSKVSLSLAAAVLIPFSGLAVLSSALVSRYPRLAAFPTEAVLDREIRKYPDDPHLRSMRGRSLLRHAGPVAALPDLAAALRIQPSKRRELDYAVALAVQGGPARGLVDSIRLERLPASLNDHPVRASALKTLASLYHGDRQAALATAVAGGMLGTPGEDGSQELRINDREYENGGGLYRMVRSCGTLPEYWPPDQRLVILDHLAAMDKPDAEFMRYMAATALQARNPERARKILGKIPASPVKDGPPR